MSDRSPLHFSASALVVLCLVVGTIADPLGAHQCAHHERGNGSANGHVGMTSGTQHGDVPTTTSDPASTEHDSDDGACTCIGSCQTVGLATWPDERPVLTPRPEFAAYQTPLESIIRAKHVAHALPFANGPPDLVF